jgi:hypothetical protein
MFSAGFAGKTVHEANIQLIKQNVFYIGVDNPISVSVNGISRDRIIVETDNGTITATGAPGMYNVRVDSLNKTNITVSYKDGGSTIFAGLYSYRNKRVPDPRTYINSFRTEGVVLKENISTIVGVFTRMENFDFDVSFKPQSFSMSVIEDGEWKEYKAIGPELTPEMKAALKKCEEEDKIIFHNVMTKGPGDDVRLSNVVIMTVK